MRKIDHFPMSDVPKVRNTSTICDIRHSRGNPSLEEKYGKIGHFSSSDGFLRVTDTAVTRVLRAACS
eukprot:COSAG05_NODE_2393_length_3124_cov_5.020489_4_plen_67_part_00